jgi:hypothetical protein
MGTLASMLVMTPPLEQSTQRAPEVEDVEGLELELTSHGFGYGNILQERGIGHVLTWTGKGIAADVAEGREGRTTEGA